MNSYAQTRPGVARAGVDALVIAAASVVALLVRAVVLAAVGSNEGSELTADLSAIVPMFTVLAVAVLAADGHYRAPFAVRTRGEIASSLALAAAVMTVWSGLLGDRWWMLAPSVVWGIAALALPRAHERMFRT